MKFSLLDIYRVLFQRNGSLNWWPGETCIEVCVGAILTQNTSWLNVEKAIDNLKKEDLLSVDQILSVSSERLSKLIRPAGYFNQKAGYLKGLCKFLKEHSLTKLRKMEAHEVRELLLNIKGIGPETADSILLYALDLPIFVIDAYTKRIFSRIGIVPSKATYQELQEFFHSKLPTDVGLFNDYHAQLVMLGKGFCNKKPKCPECPLRVTGICCFN